MFMTCYNFLVSPVAGDPTLISLNQISPTAVRLIWSPPSGGAIVNGYVVHYKTTTSVRTERAPATSIFTFLTDLTVVLPTPSQWRLPHNTCLESLRR